MSDSQSQLIVQVAAIYNWTEDTQNCNLTLEISSLLSPSQIMTKKIEGRVSNAKLLLNTTLKITYTADQKQIKLKIYKSENNKNDTPMQFLLDLELLKDKQVQFLPFKSNDKVLKVITRTDSQVNGKNTSSKISFRNNKKFINEKQEYLERLSIKSDFNRNNKKRQFCELIYQLLQQIQRIKQTKNHKKYSIYSNQNTNNNNETIDIQTKNLIKRNKTEKSAHYEDSNLLNTKITFANNNDNSNNLEKIKINLPTNRLTLRDLKIVPYNFSNNNYLQNQEIDQEQLLQSNGKSYYSILNNKKI